MDLHSQTGSGLQVLPPIFNSAQYPPNAVSLIVQH